MIFSILLTLIILFMALYAIVFIRKRQRTILLLGYALGLLVIWQPDTSTFMARALGVGRGLDLFLIVLSVVLLNAVVMLARHISLLHQQHTELVRDIAIHRALINASSQQYSTPAGASQAK